MFRTIKTKYDIEDFLEETNSLHDGYIIGVQYINYGISKTNNGYYFNPQQTKLILKILVTSINDTIIEIEFENLLEWQIRDNQYDITDITVMFDEEDRIVWLDDIYTNVDELKRGSFAIAKSMKWRIVE